MNKRILPRTEEAQIDFKKSVIRSAELLSEAKQFAIEQMSTFFKTITGHMRRFVPATQRAGLLMLGKNSTATMIALITSTANNDNSTLNSFNNIATKGLLGLAFAGTIHVTENVYNALHNLNVVTEFNKQQALIDLAYDPNFKGELPAELNAFREGHYGPLTCEFEAHAKLAEEGIQHIREDNQNMFIFPEKMVSDEIKRQDKIRQQFGDTSEIKHDTSHHVLVFRECADPRHSAHTVRSDRFQKDMVPQLIPVPKGEVLAYVPQ